MSKLISALAALAVPERVKVYPLMLGSMFLVAWLATITVYGDGVLDMSGAFIGNDFVSFYTGANLWMSGEVHHIYHLPTQSAFQSALTSSPIDAT